MFGASAMAEQSLKASSSPSKRIFQTTQIIRLVNRLASQTNQCPVRSMASKQPTPQGQQSKEHASAPKATESTDASPTAIQKQKVPHTESEPSSYSMQQWLEQSPCEDPWSAVSRVGRQPRTADHTVNGHNVVKKENESIRLNDESVSLSENERGMSSRRR